MQTPKLITAGLTQAYEFHLIKLLGLALAITTMTALDQAGHEKRLPLVGPWPMLRARTPSTVCVYLTPFTCS